MTADAGGNEKNNDFPKRAREKGFAQGETPRGITMALTEMQGYVSDFSSVPHAG